MSSLPILSCDGCGHCCREQESPPGYAMIILCRDDAPLWATADDIRRVEQLPDELVSELKQYVAALLAGKGHPNNRVCIWFDEQTRKCKHYELRPDVCRSEVVAGDASCLLWRERFRAEGII